MESKISRWDFLVSLVLAGLYLILRMVDLKRVEIPVITIGISLGILAPFGVRWIIARNKLREERKYALYLANDFLPRISGLSMANQEKLISGLTQIRK